MSANETLHMPEPDLYQDASLYLDEPGATLTHRLIDYEPPLLETVRVAACHEDKVLTGTRKPGKNPLTSGRPELLGGTIDDDDRAVAKGDPVQAIVVAGMREIEEESGAKVKITTSTPVANSIRRVQDGTHAGKIAIEWLVEGTYRGGELFVTPPEHESVSWAPIHEVGGAHYRPGTDSAMELLRTGRLA